MLRLKPLILIPLFMFVITPAMQADVYTGLAYSGVTSGRKIPGLHVALVGDDSRISFISTGAKTPVYYHNAWQLGFYATWNPGDVLWGEVEAGFGGGILHAVRGYRDDTDDEYERESNTVYGPSLYIGWELFSNVLITLEALYGVRDSDALRLIFQENCVGSIGVRF